MNNLFLAKTKNHETIQQHTDKLLWKYYQLKSLYPNIPNLNWKLLKEACLYHDLGKMNVKFQNKIMEKLNVEGASYTLLSDQFKNLEEIPHGHLSVAFLDEEKLQKVFTDEEIMILYQAIYYHHHRNASGTRERYSIITKELSSYYKSFQYQEVNLEKINSKYGSYLKKRIGRGEYPDKLEMVNQYILVKGLLNKIDYAASGDIDAEIDTDNLYNRTLEFFNQGGFEPNELQKYMMVHKEEHNIIIASTGIGKTEAALLWIGNEKGFFTLPLKVSINAIYDRVIGKIGHHKSRTGLLHSDTRLEYMKRANDVLDMEYFNRTKQLAMPLTVCTLDQLIDFVFKCEGYELKLATLAYSKLVIDEIQMYSPEMIAYLILALRDIHQLGGKFSILTATLPPIFIDLLTQQIKDFEFKPETFLKLNSQQQPMLRHQIEVHQEPINLKDITTYYQQKRILVIVNTVKKAQEIFSELKEVGYDEVCLLHSRFTRLDRGEKESAILEDGKVSTKPIIWITTQIVEASLDIDFDILYTELSELTGLFQRMGRAFRGRELLEKKTNIHIYVGQKSQEISGVGFVVDKDIFRLSKEELIKLGTCSLSEGDKMELVNQVYSENNMKETEYYKKIQDTIRIFEETPEYELEKKDVKLRDIQTQTILPRPIYDTHRALIDNLLDQLKRCKGVAPKIKIKEALMNYTVTIPQTEYDQAKRNGFSAEELEVDAYTFIPILDYEYTKEKGLCRYNPNLNGFCEETQFC